MRKDFLEKNILERFGYTPLSEKENELLDKNFEYENIDKLKDDLKKAATEEDYDKLFNFINKRMNVLKKLVKTVADNVEKERINNVIKAVKIVFDHFLNQDRVRESDYFDDKTDFDFSCTEREGLKILTPNQMLNRLPISLAQLKAGNNSEKT